MKKVLSFVSACLVLACVMVMAIAPVSAATPKEDILAKAKELVPAQYHEEYLPLLENVLQQVEVTAEQATAVIANMEAAKASVAEDKGASLSEYTSDEQAAVVAEVEAACTTLGLTCEITPAENPTHEGDMDFYVYAANGDKIADVDLDVKKTNTAVDYTMIVAAAALIAVAVGSAVYGKKLSVSR
ncbi:MAG: hypothetical protein IKU56_04965 [Clostridia bacterium]|nr:hypothetical protein [Clostridia bacterium]